MASGEFPSTYEGSLLWTLEEIGRLISESGDASETLTNIVHLIQHRFETDVCSVYLLEPDRANLVLAATIGLRPESIGRVRMRLSEGLAGLVAEQMRPQVFADATTHPRFKYFPEAGEDPLSLVSRRADRRSRRCCRACWSCRPSSRASSTPTPCGCWSRPACSSRRSSAKRGRSEQFVAPAHQRLARAGAESLVELGPRHRRACSASSTRRCGGSSTTIRSRCCSRFRSTSSRNGRPSSALHSRINYAYRRMQEYLHSTHTWGARHAGVLWARPVAYFSAEFGLHESLPIYSGGLGILAGDHLKSASDLGIPLVGVGLYYDQGYFRQRLDRDGWQHEDYIDVDHRQLPIQPAQRDGAPITIAIETRTGTIVARVWQLSVGRNTLLLLDSNVEGNRPEDRELTARLYGGDERVRIRQELLLGVGGVRALAAMGIAPGVLHLNEGHSAFAALELVRQRMATEGVDAWEAIRRVVRAGRVHDAHAGPGRPRLLFAGADRRASRTAARIARDLATTRSWVSGRVDPGDAGEPFCMTVLALKTCHRANAVSSLHGRSRAAMWRPLFPDRSEDRVPIGHITNGVHVPSWLAPQMRQVYDRHLGPDWPRHAGDPGFWERVDAIDDGELWETHQTLKTQLIEIARRRAAHQAERRGDPPEFVDADAPGAEPRRADHRLRAPVRHLQARRPDPPGPRGVRLARQQPADAGPVRVRRQVASARPARQGGAAADRPADARSRGSPARCSSSRTTTSTSAGISCRASTSGSTTRGARSKRAAPAARRWCSTAG